MRRCASGCSATTAGSKSMARAWQRLAAEHDPALARFIAPGHAEAGATEPVDLEPLKLTAFLRPLS